MTRIGPDVLVIGGGAAGMAAAAAAAEAGAKTLLFEREHEPGGVLAQCIHTGFGLHRYHEELSGPEFGDRLLRALDASGADVLCDCSVVAVSPDGPTIDALHPGGAIRVRPHAVIWATGARERPFGSLMIPGPRPAGIYTAGLAQRFVNMHGVLPGHRAIVLGSGDIGLIMARRLHLEGMQVTAVVEIQPQPGGLARNVVQCLEDYDIPLLLRHTITGIDGTDRLAGVTVSAIDESGRPVPDSAVDYAVDTLILSVGLIPDNDLILPFTPIDPVNHGPVVDARMRTAVPWLYAAGNNVAIFDLVDAVATVGEVAGRAAAGQADGDLREPGVVPLTRGPGVHHLVPGRLLRGTPTTVYLRVSRAMHPARIRIGGFYSKTLPAVRPSEMVELDVPEEALRSAVDGVAVAVEVSEA
jgi:NADPH-dependent 2,4-dienoyl-CoA reductase/sulfur reductase-like enzyme